MHKRNWEQVTEHCILFKELCILLEVCKVSEGSVSLVLLNRSCFLHITRNFKGSLDNVAWGGSGGRRTTARPVPTTQAEDGHVRRTEGLSLFKATGRSRMFETCGLLSRVVERFSHHLSYMFTKNQYPIQVGEVYYLN